MNAVDTNILIYVHDSREPRKQAVSAALVESLEDGVLLWQVACEYLSASRKLVPLGFDVAHSLDRLQRLQQAWTPVLPSWRVLDTAEGLMGKMSLSFWDAMIVSACLECGVTTLYSEDFGDPPPSIDGLKIVNPFKMQPAR